ncbi:MAG: site-2 protease family protein [Clostridia bacterium]|nr:site-2 protease family protein [Clostridia bacterium]
MFWQGLNWSVLTDILKAIIPALLCITFHELSHGFVAYKLGDNTAKNAGRLTLNPIKHIDILGLFMMVMFKFGWAKPVPINMNNFKKPKWGMAITALAGPVSNIILAALIMLIYGFVYLPLTNAGGFGKTLTEMLLTTAYMSCALAVFNIIPISPLDGSKVLFSFLPEKAYYNLMRYERFGFVLLLVLVWADVMTPFLTTATQAVYSYLSKIALWGFSLTQ